MFFLAIIFYSCKNKNNINYDCLEKKHVRYVYDKLNEMDSGYSKAEYFAGELLLTNLFLQDISELRSSAYFGDVSYYKSRREYIKDLELWKNWFNENKCDISQAKVDSVIQNIKLLQDAYKYVPEM